MYPVVAIVLLYLYALFQGYKPMGLIKKHDQPISCGFSCNQIDVQRWRVSYRESYVLT